MDGAAAGDESALEAGTAFDRLLERLDPDRNRAADKYELLRRKLVKVFECRRCAAPHDLADRALEVLERRLATDVVHDIGAFAHGVALKLCIESGRRSSRVASIQQWHEDSAALAVDSDPEGRIVGALTAARHLQCLQPCLTKLAAADRELIIEYYRGDGPARIERRRAFAEREGLAITALRNRANAIRDRLRACVNRCLKRSLRVERQ
jgi:hypothetical protein